MTHAPVRARALAAAVLGAALLSTTVACGNEDGANAGTTPSSAAWKEPAAYTYTLESTEGERSLIGKFRITVKNGEVTKAVGLDDSARRLVEQSPDQVPTIGALLAELDQAREENADKAEADYAADGHPERITLDWLEDAIDDEALYVLTEYEPADK
ncbi:putative secreted protein [Streptomyces davaonensis JCM 4913]|uniref:Putative secreted protein n=1 Tax=Streptomyces davaonensis (strain DSM 101723 / JCM 4913 / KCC S-0913 / 768) TaxID=1214101 RepID=K4QXV9_STRDJ|nr:DUF6174 domain-containing protein [Streptomyces davaonensis]CCK25214.1 putative secreted protein [Streptomyces davaonensis JCM 4913]